MGGCGLVGSELHIIAWCSNLCCSILSLAGDGLLAVGHGTGSYSSILHWILKESLGVEWPYRQFTAWSLGYKLLCLMYKLVPEQIQMFTFILLFVISVNEEPFTTKEVGFAFRPVSFKFSHPAAQIASGNLASGGYHSTLPAISQLRAGPPFQGANEEILIISYFSH